MPNAGSEYASPGPGPEAVQVVLPLPLDQAFTYRVPPALRAEARVGCRVVVPFGPRTLTGLVVADGGTDQDPAALKAVRDVLDDEPAFTDEMLRLTRWIADYYVCGWGEVVKAALPTGTEVESEYRLTRSSRPAPADLPRDLRAVLDHLEAADSATLSELRQDAGDVSRARLRRLEREGWIEIETTLRAPRVRVKHERHLRLAPPFRDPAALKDLKSQLRGSKQVRLLDVLAEEAAAGRPEPRQADALARAEAAATTVKSLVGRGVVEAFDKEVLRSPLGDLPAHPPRPPVHPLHPAQQAALGRIEAALDARAYEAFLLYGVTGSGKTEVYIQALKRTLAQGRTGIILVPEIALTPQTVQRFRAHFGDRIAVLHSRMSLGERYDAWRSLRAGRFSVVIGPRSAVLAPLTDIGLIVVDEEHESSYKQYDPAPRYHARDVAVMRAHMNGAVCLLGSATPGIESYVNARPGGKYTLLCMPERVPVPGRAAASLPAVQVVDLAKERQKNRLSGAISSTLREAVAARLARKEQVILLQNRRGYAPVIECQTCGWSPMCPDCSVTMTYHKAARHLRCHYCGRTQRLGPTCAKCGAADLSQLGAGTQRVEEELAVHFPGAVILRMDLDTTSRKNAHHTLLDRFGRGEADILIGTQMVAKGLDFGRVTLVGVINADVGLLLPDFRAEERTFQLLTQVAGRAGRAGLQGEVLLQTRNPHHPVIRYALEHDYEGFVESVLPDRRVIGYPPFGRIVGVEVRGPYRPEVEQLAQRWRGGLPEAEGLQVLGPEPAFIGRVKRQYRYHVILKAARGIPPAHLQHLIRTANDAVGSVPRGYRIAVDVDAVGLF